MVTDYAFQVANSIKRDNTLDTARFAGVKGYDCSSNRRRIGEYSCHRQIAWQGGIRCAAVDGLVFAQSSYCRYCSESCAVPDPEKEERAFMNSLMTLVRSGRYDVLLPVERPIREFSTGNYELALHSERSSRFEAFHAELNEWRRRLGLSPWLSASTDRGDLKLSRKRDKEYDPGTLTAYGRKPDLLYFSGNGTDFDSGSQVGDAFVYIPSAYWVDNSELHAPSISIEQTAKRSNEIVIVALVHPIWWVTRRMVRDDLEALVNRTTTTTLREQIQLLLEKSKKD